jgi:hypothetical protein
VKFWPAAGLSCFSRRHSADGFILLAECNSFSFDSLYSPPTSICLQFVLLFYTVLSSLPLFVAILFV